MHHFIISLPQEYLNSKCPFLASCMHLYIMLISKLLILLISLVLITIRMVSYETLDAWTLIIQKKSLLIYQALLFIQKAYTMQLKKHQIEWLNNLISLYILHKTVLPQPTILSEHCMHKDICMPYHKQLNMVTMYKGTIIVVLWMGTLGAVTTKSL